MLERTRGRQPDITAAVVTEGGTFPIMLETFFGFYPANRARAARSIEALRNE